MPRLMPRITLNAFASALRFGLAICLFAFGFQSMAVAVTPTPDDGRVVKVNAKTLDRLRGLKNDSLSLASVKNGRLVSIPSQIDEMTTEGYVYFEKGKFEAAGQAEVFDEVDELLFMLKDAGPKKSSKAKFDGKILSEIEVLNHKGQSRYVYVVQDAKILSEDVYVRYSSDAGRVETAFYSLQVDPKNAFIWKEYIAENYDGDHIRTPFDTMKLRFGSSVGFIGPRLNFSNNSIVAKPIAERTGPIRATTQYKMTLKIAKIPFLSMHLQIFRTEQSIRYNAIMKIPRLRRTLITRPAIYLSLDGYDLNGTTIRVAGGPDQPAVVDGDISDAEEKMMEVKMNADNNWIWLSTHHHYDNLTFLDFSEYDDIDVTTFIQDDPEAKNKPEFHLGQGPNIGYQIHGLPLKGIQSIDVTIYAFADDVVSDINEFASKVKAAPQIKARFY